MTRTIRLISADLICAAIALTVAIWAVSVADLFFLAMSSAFFGASFAFAWSDWRYMQSIADLERRLARLESQTQK